MGQGAKARRAAARKHLQKPDFNAPAEIVEPVTMAPPVSISAPIAAPSTLPAASAAPFPTPPSEPVPIPFADRYNASVSFRDASFDEFRRDFRDRALRARRLATTSNTAAPTQPSLPASTAASAQPSLPAPSAAPPAVVPASTTVSTEVDAQSAVSPSASSISEIPAEIAAPVTMPLPAPVPTPPLAAASIDALNARLDNLAALLNAVLAREPSLIDSTPPASAVPAPFVPPAIADPEPSAASAAAYASKLLAAAESHQLAEARARTALTRAHALLTSALL